MLAMAILIVARARSMSPALFAHAVFLIGEWMFDKSPDF